eukprot:268312_1
MAQLSLEFEGVECTTCNDCNPTDESNQRESYKIRWEDVVVDLERIESATDKFQTVELKGIEHTEKDTMDEEKKEYEYLNVKKALRNAGISGGTSGMATGGVAATATEVEGAAIVASYGLVGAISFTLTTAVGIGVHSVYTYWNNWKEDLKLDKIKQHNDKVNLFNRILIKCKETEEQIDQRRQLLIIQEEKLKNAEFMVERLSTNTKVMVCLGPCGYGKSVVCNRLLGDTQSVYDLPEVEDARFSVAKFGDTKSHTKTMQKQFKKVVIEDDKEEKSFRLSVVDTQGAFDSDGNDKHHQNQLAQYFKACGGINMFCIFFKFGEKIDANYQKLLKIYTTFWGEGFWKHCVVIITNCDKGAKQVEKGLPMTMRQVKEFLKDVSKGLCTDVPIYQFGEDNFELSTFELLLSLTDKNAVYIRKYKCDNTRSPIDALFEEVKLLSMQWCKISVDLNKLSTEIKDTQNKI